MDELTIFLEDVEYNVAVDEREKSVSFRESMALDFSRNQFIFSRPDKNGSPGKWELNSISFYRQGIEASHLRWAIKYCETTHGYDLEEWK